MCVCVCVFERGLKTTLRSEAGFTALGVGGCAAPCDDHKPGWAAPRGPPGGRKLAEHKAVCPGREGCLGVPLLYHVPQEAGCPSCVQRNPLKMLPWHFPLEPLSFRLFPGRGLAQRKEERWAEAGTEARRGLSGDGLQSFPPAPPEIHPRALSQHVWVLPPKAASPRLRERS